MDSNGNQGHFFLQLLSLVALAAQYAAKVWWIDSIPRDHKKSTNLDLVVHKMNHHSRQTGLHFPHLPLRGRDRWKRIIRIHRKLHITPIFHLHIYNKETPQGVNGSPTSPDSPCMRHSSVGVVSRMHDWKYDGCRE
jgi:hypothetical protein